MDDHLSMEDEFHLLREISHIENHVVKCNLDAASFFGEPFELQCCKPTSLSSAMKDEIFSMLETNMKTFYESSWGWNADEKKKEIFSNDSYYLLVHERDSSGQDSLCGFTMFRFCWDDEDEPEHVVLFCYELQIASRCQRRGFGKKLMSIVVAIADYWKVWKTMLTVFKNNTEALEFYKHIDFGIDSNSPSAHGFLEAPYEILSNFPLLK